MAESSEARAPHSGGEESLMEKIAEKLHLKKEEEEEKDHHHHHHDDDKLSSSSASDSEDEKPKTTASPSDAVKAKIFRLFGREKPVHQVLGGGKRMNSLSLSLDRIYWHFSVFLFALIVFVVLGFRFDSCLDHHRICLLRFIRWILLYDLLCKCLISLFFVVKSF